MAGSGQRFFHERGGVRDGQRGRAYFESLNFHVYESEEGKNIKLKDFMIEHITSFEPAIFLGLVDDWDALSKWNLDSEEGEQQMINAFGEELVQVLSFKAGTYSYYWKSTEIDYKPINEILEGMKTQKDYSNVYKTRSSRISGSGVTKNVVLDQEIPVSI